MAVQADPAHRDQIAGFLCNPNAQQTPAMKAVLYPGSKTRYRFNDRDAAIRSIFQAAYKFAPDETIRKAEAATGHSLYPLWKRVCYIQAPRLVGTLLSNTIVKIIILIPLAIFGFTQGQRLYAATQIFIQASAVPFAINHTPVQIMRVFNRVIDGAAWIYDNPLMVIFYGWIGRTVILWGPEIPYLTPAARALDLTKVFFFLVRSPETIFWFGLQTIKDGCSFFWSGATEVGQFLLETAHQNEAERIVACQEPSYQSWLRQFYPPQIRA